MRDKKVPLIAGATVLRSAFALVLLAGLLAVVGSGPVGAQDPTETDASVRVVHASPDAPAVDVVVDGLVVVEGLSFGEVSPYLPLSPREHQIQIVPTGADSDSAVIDTTFEPESGKAYIIAAVGLLNEIEAETYEINLDDLDDGQARIRVIHLVPDAENVDLFVAGGDELVDDVEFREASDYTDIEAGTYDLEVRQQDSETVVLDLPGLRVRDGDAYELLVIGQVADQSVSALPLVTSVDQPCTAVLNIGSSSDACVRVVHAVPDAPPVDVYVNDSLVIAGLEYGLATEFAALPAGDDQNLKLVPAGSPIEEAVIDEEIDFEEGRAYQIVAANMLEDIQTIVNDEVNLGPLPAGQSRVRVTHASPGTDEVDVVITDGPDLFTDLSFDDVAEYQVLDAGTYDIQVRQDDEVLLRVPDLVIEADTVYDFIAVGRTDDGTFTLLALVAPSEPRGDVAATPEETSLDSEAEVATPAIEATPDA